MAEIHIMPGRIAPRDVISVLFKHKWALLWVYAVLLATVGAYCFFWPPTYEARVRFLVKNDRQVPVISPDQENVRVLQRPLVTEDELNSEMAIVTSAGVLEQTVRDMHLDRLPEHWAIALLSAPFNYLSSAYNRYHGKRDQDEFGKAVGRLARKVGVEAEKKSSILSVKVRWGDPAFAESILQRLCENYEAAHLAAHRAPDTQAFFLERLNEKNVELAEIEKRIEAVRPGATTGMLALEKEIYLKQAADFEAESRRTRALVAEAQAKVDAGTKELAGMPQRVATEEKVLSNPVALGNLKSRVLELELKYRELLGKYKPDQPKVKEAEDELAAARRMLNSEMEERATERSTNLNQVEQTVRQDLLLNRTRLQSLGTLSAAMQREFQAYRSRLDGVQKSGFVLQQLDRERKAAEQAVFATQKRYEEARTDDQLNRMHLVNVVPIEPVRSDADPVKPNRGLLVRLALVLGLAVSIGFAFSLELLDQRVRSERDLPGDLGVPVVATLERYGSDTLTRGLRSTR